MVLNQTVDGAAVDSVSLGMQMKMNSAVRDNLIVLKSWGPIAAHPIVVNTRLSSEMIVIFNSRVILQLRFSIVIMVTRN